MSFQTSYQYAPDRGIAGQAADSGVVDSITRILASRQLDRVVVTTQSNAEVFRITLTTVVNGVTTTTNYDYTSDGSGSKIEIADGLAALINAGSQPVTAFSDGVDTVLLEADRHDEDGDFTTAVTSPATGVLTLTAGLVAHRQSVPFGSGVCRDERQTLTPAGTAVTGKFARLPRVSGDLATGIFQGILLADTSRQYSSGGHPANEPARILRKGRVLLYVEGTVTEGQQLYCRYTVNGSAAVGQFRADADSSKAAAVPVYTLEARTGAGLVLCEINIP
jgi:hypothetical protein